MMFYRGICISIAVFAGAFLSACSITTAPTDASSETVESISELSSDLSSSTSGGEDSSASSDFAAKRFVKSNFDRLRSDMAVGEGEYLSSLATLLAIGNGDKSEFYALTKANFSQLFVSSSTTPEELFANLQRELQLAQI